MLTSRRRFRGNKRWAFLPMLALASALHAEVILPSLFSDGMILQRGQPIRIWGKADAGERIVVSFADQTAAATANPQGRWDATLPPLTASATGRELRVAGNNTRVLRDVLVGDVWVCAGQSNMEMTVKGALDTTREIAAANFPAIRSTKIGRRLSETPQEDALASAWRRAVPAEIGSFSAAGYFFARTFWRETGVPVGLIDCTWSGTSIEPWMDAMALSENPAFAAVWERWRADVAAYPERRAAYERSLAEWKVAEHKALAAGEAEHARYLAANRQPRPPASAPDHPYPGNPTQIYYGMVHPLRHAAIRGVLWYQGEANAVRAPEYAALFQASIRGWRRAFGQSELPFYFVQIANFDVETDWPRLREAQARALTLPATGMAVTIDIGDPADIHPRNKQEVGWRLALLALEKLERRPLESSGPLFAGVDFVDHAAKIRFTHAAGLNSHSGPVQSLELAGVDRVFHPAEGRIEGETLVVRSADVPEPISVRYAWRASPQANLYNLAGLPAAPFRSDAW